MPPSDLTLFDTAAAWAAQGQRFALITLARAWGSAPRPVGSLLLLREDGAVAGSVSGGCIEDDLIERLRNGRLLTPAQPYLLNYGVTAEEAGRFGLPCGGTLELVVEPAPNSAHLAELAAHLRAGRLMQRQVRLDNGQTQVLAAPRNAVVTWRDGVLTTVHGAQWRLLIVGAGAIAQVLAPMARALDYAVTVSEPRAEYRATWDIADALLTPEMPDDALQAMQPDERLAVAALTHDPKLDDLVLIDALKSPAFYVGALGSQRNNEKRRARLAEHFDLTPSQLARLRGPIGLPIGSRSPAEIAVSILAEMTAVKRGVVLVDKNPVRTE